MSPAGPASPPVSERLANEQLRSRQRLPGGRITTRRKTANVNAPTQQNENRPRAGQGTRRIWLIAICGLAIIIGGAFLVRSRGSSETGHGSAPVNAVAPAIASAVTQVSMRNLQFYPVTIKVKSGDVVEWKNDDLVPHTATAATFDSGTILSGRSWRRTFTYAGHFPYVCTFHPQMKGVVIVEESRNPCFVMRQANVERE